MPCGFYSEINRNANMLCKCPNVSQKRRDIIISIKRSAEKINLGCLCLIQACFVLQYILTAVITLFNENTSGPPTPKMTGRLVALTMTDGQKYSFALNSFTFSNATSTYVSVNSTFLLMSQMNSIS